jgi:4-amino-4-deoxy-L-arabinose transferase-like glycosyltransferase
MTLNILTAGPRALGRRLPVAARVCFVIAFLNATCWAFITPLFQVDDEPDHFAAVQQIAETQTLPRPVRGAEYSAEETTAMTGLNYRALRFEAAAHAIVRRSEQQMLQQELAAHPSRVGGGDAGVADSEPPLYYLLQTIPYELGSGRTILVRMQLMRLLSALMAGCSALFIFLFLRELLPRASWAWTVGGLSAAFAPLLGFISGAINPEAMLTAVSAMAFFCLARGFRRGLSPGLACAIGAVMAVGLLTKLNFVALVPGMVLGIVILAARAARTSRREALRSLALALLIAFSPAIIYTLVKLNTSQDEVERFSDSLNATNGNGSLWDQFSYIWQSYLPRLPGMANDFPGAFIPREVWFNDVVGLYGWENISFPDWVQHAAVWPVIALVALSLRALVAGRRALWSRGPELVVYLLMGLGVLVLLGATAFSSFPQVTLGFRAPRYLLPLLPLACAGLALAARGAGKRWGPVVGTLIVVLLIGHDLFSQLLAIGHYYG